MSNLSVNVECQVHLHLTVVVIGFMLIQHRRCRRESSSSDTPDIVQW